MKCPQCQLDNTPDSKFSGECGTQLLQGEKIFFSKTITLETPFKVLDKGSNFAGNVNLEAAVFSGGPLNPQTKIFGIVFEFFEHG